MRRRLMFSLPTVAALLLLAVSGCDLFGSDEALPFAWFQPVTRFAYDYDSASDPYVDEHGNRYIDADSAFILKVIEPETDYADLRVFTGYPSPAWDFSSVTGTAVPILDGLTQMVPPPERSEDGLRVGYYTRCETPPINLSDTETVLWIPADPVLGETYRLYECAGRKNTSHRVVAVDTTLTVPAGTFENVFVLFQEADRYDTEGGGQRTYWSEPKGLIQVEKFYADGSLIGTYKLRSSNR